MTGGVTGRHALLPIPIRLPNQPEFTVESVVHKYGYTVRSGVAPPVAISFLV